MSNQSMMHKVSVPYAEALLELAQNSNSLQPITNDLSLVADILSKSVDLQRYLFNPLIRVSAKKNLLQELLKDQISDKILNFLFVLLDRRRIFLINTIIEKYLELTYKVEATVLVYISSAIALNEDQQQELVNKIKDMTSSQNVKLVININPSLIGGFTIKIGSKIIDVSLLGRLQQMSLYLNKL